MTIRLAVDTVTDSGSVSLEVGGDAVADQVFLDRQHAARLLPSIMMCLQTADLQVQQLDEVMIADGPGSFTGMRIGFATVAGLIAQSSPRVLVAPSMMATAVAAARDGGGPVVALYDALRGEVYAACYRVRNATVETMYPPHVTTVADLAGADSETPVVAVGSGALAYAAEVSAWTGAKPCVDPAHASNLFGLRRLQGGFEEVTNLSSFDLNYGREAEAQVRWERQHGRRLSDSIGST